MNKRICLVLWTVGLLAAWCYATDDNQEFRANASFGFKLNDVWKLKITEEFHFRDGNYFEQENDALFVYKGLSDKIDLGLGFKQVHCKDSSGSWQRENRPYAELTLKETIFGLKWSDRNRLEYRDYENKEDAFRYRNRLKMQVPVNLFDLPLQPYVADEIFVMERSGCYRNRIYTGLIWDVSKTLDVDVFIFQEKNDTSHGSDTRYMYGFQLCFAF